MRIDKTLQEVKDILLPQGFTIEGSSILRDGISLFSIYEYYPFCVIYNEYGERPQDYISWFYGNDTNLNISLQDLGLLPYKGLLVTKNRLLTPEGYRKYLLECNGKSEKAQKSWAYKVLRKKNFFVTTHDGQFLPKCLCVETYLNGEKTWLLRETFYLSVSSWGRFNGGYWTLDRMYEINGEYLPLSYIISRFNECDECGYIHVDSTCPRCARRYEIKSYSERAEHTLPFKDDGEASPVYLGIELEYENCTSKAKDVYIALHNHVIVKRDGSLSSGFEIVTAPATIASHKREFKGFYDKVTGLEALSNCGMHVHVDKRSMGEMQIGKMLAFIYKKENIPSIEALAGRSFSSNRFCKASSERTLTDGLYGNLDGVSRDSAGKYEALNTSPKNTIEVRIFAPPTDETTLFMRLEFVQALVDWTKPAICSVKDAVSWEKFRAFVWGNKKMYPNLIGAIA